MGSREVSATVMAFESPVALAVLGGVVLGIMLESIGCCLGGLRIVRGGGWRVAAAEFLAEKPNAFFFNWCWTDERELRKRFNVHEVKGLSLTVLVHEWREREREDGIVRELREGKTKEEGG